MMAGMQTPQTHLGGTGGDAALADPAWATVGTLAARGAWLKLSGWYRLNSKAPYADLIPTIRRLADLFGEHMIWGADWPHTLFGAESMPPYSATWMPVVDALGAQAAEALRCRRPAIYL